MVATTEWNSRSLERNRCRARDRTRRFGLVKSASHSPDAVRGGSGPRFDPIPRACILQVQTPRVNSAHRASHGSTRRKQSSLHTKKQHSHHSSALPYARVPVLPGCQYKRKALGVTKLRDCNLRRVRSWACDRRATLPPRLPPPAAARAPAQGAGLAPDAWMGEGGQGGHRRERGVRAPVCSAP